MKKIDMNLIPDTVNMSPDYYCNGRRSCIKLVTVNPQKKEKQ